MKIILDVENTTTKRDGKLHLDPFEPDNSLTLVGVQDWLENESSVFVFDHNEKVITDDDADKRLQRVLDNTTLLIGHNLQYDLQWLWACGFKYDGEIFDTMLGAYILQRGQKGSVSLENCAERYNLEVKKSDTLKDYFRRGFQTNEIPLDELSEYLRQDLAVTKDLYWKLMEEYDKPEGKTLDKVLDVSNKVCKSLAKMYMRGFAIDKDVLEEVKQDFETELREIEERLQSQVKRLMGDTPINLNSPEQVSRILKNKKEWVLAFDNVLDKDDFRKTVKDNSYLMVKTKASICHTCKGKGRVHKIKKDGTPFAKPSRCPDCDTRGYLLTKSNFMAGLGFFPLSKDWISANGFSTSKGNLEQLINIAKSKAMTEAEVFLTDLKRQSAVSSYLSSFVEGIGAYTKEDGKLHVSLTQHVTATGRFSGRNPNMQNMPRGGTFPVKKVFVSRWDGGKIVEADFAQLEFRVAAFLSQDQTAMDEVNTGFDVHSYTAKVISNAGQPTSRQDAKAHTFAPLYGATGFGRTKAEAEYYKHFMKKYKGIAGWHKRLGDQALNEGVVTVPSGRQYAFPDVERRASGSPTHFTMIKNYPVQGFATGDIVPIVLLEIDKRLEGLQSCLVNTVHDSVVIDVHPAEETEVINLIKQVNDDLNDIIDSYYDVKINVPMVLEAKIGNNWLDTKDVM
jgi:DNA polymerase I-like protein with 3'-5' exonuclease and polymerase domains